MSEPAGLPEGTGPLAGVKVLDLSWIVAGPTVGRALADYGATVIRVESPTRVDTARVVGPFHGDEPGVENSGLYGNVNAGKWGLTLDLRIPEARDIFRRLVQWSDIVSESFTAGILGRWELDYEHLRRDKPDLIMLSSTLLGQTGPYNTVSGFGSQGAGMAGVQYLVGWPDYPPAGPFGPYTDYPAPRFALAGLLAALDHRRRTGEGVFIDQAQAEGTLQLLAPALIDYKNGGPALERLGNDDPQMSPHGVYPCQPPEGRAESWIAIAVASHDQWVRLAPIIRAEASLTLPDRRERKDAIDELITAWTSRRAAAEVESILQTLGISAHVLSNTEEAANDPQLRHRDHFRRIPHPLHGETVVEGPRYILSDTPIDIARPAPQYGEHNEQILRDVLGLSEEEIQSLAASGALS
ncbi:MAG: CoA transferase [Chloroflexi bacterium]|nr:CoA transferase [Chloroflexota bacterium]